MNIKNNNMKRTILFILSVLLTTATAWATVTWDGGTGTTGDPYYVNMPKGSSKAVDVSDGSVTTFMVYDDGGPDAGYSVGYGGAVIITAPDGYRIRVSGSVNTEGGSDYLTILDGTDPNDANAMGTQLLEASGETTISTASETGSMIILFYSDNSITSDGFALTVTLEAMSGSHAINIADCAGGCAVTASPALANTGQTVTLTAAPAGGYVLGSLSVRDEGGNIVDVTDMLWYTNTNTATFTMPNSDVTITPVFTNVMTADGGLTVNMPKRAAKRVTIPSGVTSFKVYDYGGADANYLGENGQHLYLTAPNNCVLQLGGTVTTKAGGATTFTVYDGTNHATDDYLVNNVCSATDGTAVTIPAVVSSGESMYLAFSTDDSDNFAGLDLTVTVISPGEYYAVTVSNADDKKGTMTADVATATLGTTVTLTATPDEGCVLSDLSVTCGGRAVKVDWNVWTNSATFRMPNGAVTVTPSFTSDLTSLAVCLPAQGNKNVTIPEGVASFKIYDDGGPDGNYTPYCNGGLLMTAAEGSQLRFTGSVTGPEDKFDMKIDNTKFTATTTDIDITSTGDKPMFYLQTGYADTGAGLDLTATVLYPVSVATGISNGSVTPSVANAAADETVTLTVAPAADCIIGTVTVNGATLEAVNGVYSFKMPAKNVTVTVHFRKLLSHTDIAVADIPTQTYDGTALTPAVTVTDDGSPMTFDTDYTVSYENNTDAGTATVTITGIGNYDGTKTKTFAIDKATINPTVSITGWTYGDTPNAPSVTGNTGNGAVTYQYRLNAHGAPGFSDAVPTFTGQYTVKATIAETANYKGGEATATFAIAQKPVTITGLSVENKAYDGTTTATITGTATVDGVIGSDDVSVYMGSAEFEDKNVGTGKTVTFSGFYLIGESVHDYTLSAQPASVTADITVKVVNYGAMTISEDQDGIVATLDGDSNEPFAITNNILAKKVYFRRKFVAGVPTTICLPFDFSNANFDHETFGTLQNVDENKETHQLVAHMTPVTELQANTPYYFEPTETTAPANQDYTEIVFDNVTIVAGNAGSSTTGDWTIVGNYDRVKWTTDTTDPLYSSTHAAELGRAYGYAKKTKTVDGVTYQEGQFVKLGDGAHTRAFRAYMLAPATTDSPDLLPDAIDVVWHNDDGTTSLNPDFSLTPGLSPKGEESDYWYTLDGRKLAGKPTTNGLYIHNGRKVVIKREENRACTNSPECEQSLNVVEKEVAK